MDAEEILKMEELMEEYPQQLEKHLPCNIVNNGGPIINNEVKVNLFSSTSMQLKRREKRRISTYLDKTILYLMEEGRIQKNKK